MPAGNGGVIRLPLTACRSCTLIGVPRPGRISARSGMTAFLRKESIGNLGLLANGLIGQRVRERYLRRQLLFPMGSHFPVQHRSCASAAPAHTCAPRHSHSPVHRLRPRHSHFPVQHRSCASLRPRHSHFPVQHRTGADLPMGGDSHFTQPAAPQCLAVLAPVSRSGIDARQAVNSPMRTRSDPCFPSNLRLGGEPPERRGVRPIRLLRRRTRSSAPTPC